MASSDEETPDVWEGEEPEYFDAPVLHAGTAPEEDACLQAVLGKLRAEPCAGGSCLFVTDVVYQPPLGFRNEDGQEEEASGEILLLGREKGGQSIVAHVHGWCPYLLVPVERSAGDARQWQQLLNGELLTHLDSIQRVQQVDEVRLVQEETSDFFGNKQLTSRLLVSIGKAAGALGRAASAVYVRDLRLLLETTKRVSARWNARSCKYELHLVSGKSSTSSLDGGNGFHLDVCFGTLQRELQATEDLTQACTKQLLNELQNLLQSRRQKGADPVVHVEVLDQEMADVRNYQGSKKHCLLKVHMKTPQLVNMMRDLLEESVGLEMDPQDRFPVLVHRTGGTRTFNSNVDVVLQFLCDQRAACCQWVCLTQEAERPSGRLQAHDGCRELDVDAGHLRWQRQENGVGAVRVLSFDLEAAGRRGVFPQPSEDPVIQVACHLAVGEGLESGPFAPILLSWKTCNAIEGATVLSFETEEAMLLAFAKVVEAFDPDVLTGYNIVNFDLEYLHKRAEHLGIGDEFNLLMSRLQTMPLTVREAFFQSAQTGKRKRNMVRVAGRLVLDVFVYLSSDSSYRLDSYSLNSVSAHFLGDQKVDLPFTQITPLWNQDAEGRKTLGVYCLKDALLPVQLMQKLNILLNVVEMARATGLPANWVLSRGLLIRFMSLLLREAWLRGFVVPYVRSGSVVEEGKYEGATVLDSVPGMHEHVAVLDFSSMYPSIIIAHNICPSTFLQPGVSPFVSRFEEVRINAGRTHRFAKAEVQEGVLPAIVSELVRRRAQAKRDVKNASTKAEAALHNARQTAFKILGNSMYGAMGSMMSKLPFRVGSESVTAIGRRDIALVKGIAETFFAKGAHVVAGDTDSCMIALPVVSGGLDEITVVGQGIAMAKELVEAVNAKMVSPKQIAFEKLCRRILILKKKRYCMLKYESADEAPKLDIKGVECVRRDGCPLVRDVVYKVLACMVETGDVEAGAALARETLLKVTNDQVPLASYAIAKVLRKSAQECSFPMSSKQLEAIRFSLASARGAPGNVKAGQPLSYEEQDEAIQHKIKLDWRWRIRLPHVDLAHRLRCKDPGSAPVLGERIQYVVTMNGGKKLYEKVEALVDVERRRLVVDRQYYLKALQTPLEGIFMPLALQRHANREEAERLVNSQLWPQGPQRLRTVDAEQRRSMLEASPLMQCFKRQCLGNA